ncbi:S24 family peptidase [Acidovorax sp. PRC11]|uniref:LexA family protein n=1 Tax=Acidovorax sp. PRC11 TaxID=2962592 RepID=UPI002881625D|nr:S24 family peptidase [Acidovorax sp. PRC11]MDT0140195.1 S24 family peptidase [Acidovorax sp. PRC11]
MDTLARRAKAARKHRHLTQTQVAKASGVNQSDISKIERGETERPQGLLALARAYQCDPDWLDTGDGPPPWGEPEGAETEEVRHNPPSDLPNIVVGPEMRGRRLYPVISAVQAGDWTAICDTFQPGEAEDWLPSPKDLGQVGFILKVKGPSMTNPEGGRENFPDGISLHIRPEEDVHPGDFVVAKRVADDEATFKKLVKVDGELYLHAINPNWPKPYIKLEPGDKIVGKLKFAGWDF